MVTAIRGRGTEEAAWREWTASAGWPQFDLTPYRRAVVVAPHPDDEVLGAGGIMATLAGQGAELTVMAVTDGEGSDPQADPRALGRRRTAESVAALADLGVGQQARVRLGIADGDVAAAVDRVADAIAGLLSPGDLCLATWRGDGHPDHEATGAAAALACVLSGATLVEYPIWTWHWASLDDVRVPWHRAAVVQLADQVAARKDRAMDRFVSQTEPTGTGPDGGEILPPFVLDRFRRGWELILR